MLFEMTDHHHQNQNQFYNPDLMTTNLTQEQLMEKFNLAFYETQNISKDTSSFASPFSETNDDYLIDFLIKSPESPPTTAGGTEEDDHFDFNDFVEDFEQNTAHHHEIFGNYPKFQSINVFTSNHQQQQSQFFISPDAASPSNMSSAVQDICSRQDFINNDDDLYLSDIELCDSLSTASIIDFDNLDLLKDLDDAAASDRISNMALLPPINTITKNNVDFNNFLRNAPSDNLNNCFERFNISTSTSSSNNHEFGHLIGTTSMSNDFDETILEFDIGGEDDDNQIVTTQNDALMIDDDLLLLGTTGDTFNSKNSVVDDDKDDDDDSRKIKNVTSILQCEWERCYQFYDSQSSLVKHIEKCHVEIKRGDEFTCYWANCPRQVKPFNARYKLLIHMRVHSGEKPNKCPFNGCNKAFSRLENLKIHQRSHTGERPYLCQFSNCTKSFSNSSDRAKHQRTHFDTKPYACQVVGCLKKYTDPSSLRKHVKNHTYEEQMLIKKNKTPVSSSISGDSDQFHQGKRFLDNKQIKVVKNDHQHSQQQQQQFQCGIYKSPSSTNLEHNYSNRLLSLSSDDRKKFDSTNIRQDLKNKIKLRKSSSIMYCK